jgi:uncharacterized membrane protein YidH (DUF202 family)
MDRKAFDEVILLIMSLLMLYFGFLLFLAPNRYKAFAAALNRPFARTPIWVVRGLGTALVAGGLLLLHAFLTKWP